MIKHRFSKHSEMNRWNEFASRHPNVAQLEERQRIASSNQELRQSLRYSAKMQKLLNEQTTEIEGGVENYDYHDDLMSDVSTSEVCRGRLLSRSIDYFKVRRWLREVEDFEGFEQMRDFLTCEKVREAIDLHSRLVNITNMSESKLKGIFDVEEVMSNLNTFLDKKYNISSDPLIHDIKELCLLINNVHMQNVLEIVGLVPSIFKTETAEQGTMRVVTLQKDREIMGMTIENEMGLIIVSRIVSGGQIDQTGSFHVRDKLISVNGKRLSGISVDDAQLMLRKLRGEVKFVVQRSGRVFSEHIEPHHMYLRTLFSYNHEDDEEIPCVDLGISFGKRTIFAVVDTSDDNWWQVRQDDENGDSIYGIIPSPSLQLCRERAKKRKMIECQKNGCCRRQKNVVFDILPCYEEVVLHYPEKTVRSVIVLIGSDNDAVNNIVGALLKTYRDLFNQPLLHVTRKPKKWEIDGIHAHFVSKKNFMRSVSLKKFFEYSSASNGLSGTQTATIRKIGGSDSHCLVHCRDPQALKGIHETSLFPHVIFVCPPNIQVLREQMPEVREQDLREIIDRGRFIEDKFGRYIDQVVVNQSLPQSVQQIMVCAKTVDLVPNWVPLKWIRNL